MVELSLPIKLSGPYVFKISFKIAYEPLPEIGLIIARGNNSGGTPIKVINGLVKLIK